jgi:hypothetical protein
VNRPKKPGRTPGLDALAARYSDRRIPGGCADCAAYQTVAVVDGVYFVTVHHDDTCPTYRAHRRRTRRRR